MGRFNSWICNRGTRFCPVPYDIIFCLESDSIIVSFSSSTGFWRVDFPVLVPTYHMLFPFIVFSLCIVVFIDKLRARTCKYAISVRCVSQQRIKTEPVSPTYDFHINRIGAHAFSPGTSLDEALGHSYCCDLGSLLLKTIPKRLSPNSFSFKERY